MNTHNTDLSRACLASARSTALRQKHLLSIAALVYSGKGHLLTGDGPLPVAAIRRAFIGLQGDYQQCWDGLDERAATLTRFLQRNREWAARQARGLVQS